MSDDLVKRLLNAAEDAEKETSKAIRDYPAALCEAADRIEALEAQLAEARAGLEKLQNAAGEVSRQGAVTGPQWTRLNIALLSARATLAKIGGEGKG